MLVLVDRSVGRRAETPYLVLQRVKPSGGSLATLLEWHAGVAGGLDPPAEVSHLRAHHHGLRVLLDSPLTSSAGLPRQWGTPGRSGESLSRPGQPPSRPGSCRRPPGNISCDLHMKGAGVSFDAAAASPGEGE